MFPFNAEFSPPDSTSYSPPDDTQTSFQGQQGTGNNGDLTTQNFQAQNSNDEDLIDDLGFAGEQFDLVTYLEQPSQQIVSTTPLTPPHSVVASTSVDVSQPQSQTGTAQENSNYNNFNTTDINHLTPWANPQVSENGQLVNVNNNWVNPQITCTYPQVSPQYGPVDNQPGPSWRIDPWTVQPHHNEPTVFGGIPDQRPYNSAHHVPTAVATHDEAHTIQHETNRIHPAQLENHTTPAGALPSAGSIGTNSNIPRQPAFSHYKEYNWVPLCDKDCKAIEWFNVRVADVKFSEIIFGEKEMSFCASKRNQIKMNMHIDLNHLLPPYFVGCYGRWYPILQLKVTVNGVDNEDKEIKVVQTNYRKKLDGKKQKHWLEPSLPSINPMDLLTPGFHIRLKRLHFCKSTKNNKNSPNPNQQYFFLVVNLLAVTEVGDILVRAVASERIIVRSQAQSQRKCPDIPPGCPSSEAYKFEIKDVDTATALDVIRKLVPKTFLYKQQFIEKWDLSSEEQTGFIAEEVELILPEAVLRFGESGEFLSIDQKRIAMECIVAVIEMSRVTDRMQAQLDKFAHELNEIVALGEKKRAESIASGLNRLGRQDSQRSAKKVHRTCSARNLICYILLGIITIFLGIIASVAIYNVVLDHCMLERRPWPVYPNRTEPPENIILPVERLRILQRDVAPVGTVGYTYHNNSYCCNRLKGKGKSDTIDHNKVQIYDDFKIQNDSFLHKNKYQISLPLLNAALDSRFCVWNSCRNRRGKHRLYVPLSGNLPPASQIIRFMVPDGKIVQACGYIGDQQRPCHSKLSDSKMKTRIRKIDDSLFELPIGHLLESAFVFRIGYASEMCSLSKNSHAFDEVIIHFYRKCP